jgi:hypothetical protein
VKVRCCDAGLVDLDVAARLSEAVKIERDPVGGGRRPRVRRWWRAVSYQRGGWMRTASRLLSSSDLHHAQATAVRTHSHSLDFTSIACTVICLR